MSLNADLLRSSLSAAAEREAIVTARFYRILFTRYPQVEPLFGRNSRENQQKMLQESLLAVLEHVDDPQWLSETLGSMGAQHVDYEVTEEMYPWVGECLIAALAEILGDDWTPEHQQAWSDALGAVSSLMIAGARSRQATTI